MPLPNVNLIFKTQGISAIARSEKGVVAVILQDSAALGAHEIKSAADIPQELGLANKDYVKQALMGYISPPKKLLLFVMDNEELTLADALAHFADKQLDYLVGPPDMTGADAQAIAQWVKQQRANEHTVKAVLPELEADSEGVVNFTAANIKVGEQTLSAAQYCARIAGLIAGTPMTVSCTYAPLGEVTSVEALSKEALDDAVDAGRLVLFHDGEKVKVGRGVNSLVTTTQDKGAAFRKIKIVEAMDMIKNDIRMTAQDSYIGKYANSYDNKCLLIMAIKGYFEELERGGILEAGHSAVEIDLEAQEAYLTGTGVDVSGMSVQEIKEASTGSKVFLTANIRILDAIEDIDLIINI